MLEEDKFPSNSRTRRDISAREEKKQAEEPKVVKKVTTSEVVRRKRPWYKRGAETVLGGEPKSVMGYVMTEVLLPAARDTVTDAISQGVERLVYGEARSTSRRNGLRPSTPHTPYNRYTSPSRREEPRRELSRRARAAHDFDEVILATRPEAEEVLNQLDILAGKYGVATVADLYELLGLTSSFTDAKYGWDDLRNTGVTRVRNGYLLDLPRPEPVD